MTNSQQLWITFAPISSYVEDYYHVSASTVNMLSIVYMIIYIPFVFLSSWVIDHKGLKTGVFSLYFLITILILTNYNR